MGYALQPLAFSGVRLSPLLSAISTSYKAVRSLLHCRHRVLFKIVRVKWGNLFIYHCSLLHDFAGLCKYSAL